MGRLSSEAAASKTRHIPSVHLVGPRTQAIHVQRAHVCFVVEEANQISAAGDVTRAQAFPNVVLSSLPNMYR